MSEKETNPYATKEWRIRTARSVFDVSVEEAEIMFNAGLLTETRPSITDIARRLFEGAISEVTAEKMIRAVTGRPPRHIEIKGPAKSEGPTVEITGPAKITGPMEIPGPEAEPDRPEPAVGTAERPDYLKDLEVGPEQGMAKYIVVGQPPLVMRALRQPIFDTIIVPESGIIHASAFSDSRWFPDHTPKDQGRDCNITQDGSLGMPLEFDLYYLEVVFEKFAHPEDVRRILRSTSLAWYFGQNVAWLRTTLSQFQPSFCYENLDGMEEAVEEAIERFGKDGTWPVWRHDMREKETGKPRRISSTESFHCKLEGNCGELYAPVRIKIKMQDTLYVPI